MTTAILPAVTAALSPVRWRAATTAIRAPPTAAMWSSAAATYRLPTARAVTMTFSARPTTSARPDSARGHRGIARFSATNVMTGSATTRTMSASRSRRARAWRATTVYSATPARCATPALATVAGRAIARPNRVSAAWVSATRVRRNASRCQSTKAKRATTAFPVRSPTHASAASAVSPMTSASASGPATASRSAPTQSLCAGCCCVNRRWRGARRWHRCRCAAGMEKSVQGSIATSAPATRMLPTPPVAPTAPQLGAVTVSSIPARHVTTATTCPATAAKRARSPLPIRRLRPARRRSRRRSP